jgi:hypothetical protein
MLDTCAFRKLKNKNEDDNSLGGGGESVVDQRVGQVVSQVLERALAGDNSLHEEASHGEHSQAAVLELLHLELGERIGIIGEAQGVEGTTGVEAIEILGPGTSTLTSTSAESLGLSHEDDQHGDGGDDGLGVDQVGVAEVVEAVLGEDGSLDLEPFGVGAEVNGARALELLGDEAAEGAEHGPASVDDLDLAIAGKGFGVGGQTGGIPAVVTGVFALQVRGDIALGEGAQELGTVGAVELDRSAGGLAGTLQIGVDGEMTEKEKEKVSVCEWNGMEWNGGGQPGVTQRKEKGKGWERGRILEDKERARWVG